MPKSVSISLRKVIISATLIVSAHAVAQTTIQSSVASTPTTLYTPGNLVVAVEGCGIHAATAATCAVANGEGTQYLNSSNGGYGDNQGAPLTLFQYSVNGTSSVGYLNSLTLPQSFSGANFPVSGEYGSSSEGGLQLSGAGQYLTIMGYGLNPSVFNMNPSQYGAAPSLALAQSGSLTGQSYTAVPRVVALVDPYGHVNSSTAIYNVFNTNNPRSIFTQNGTTAYISGQGSGSDLTGGVFYTPLFAINNSPTPITGADTSGNTLSQETRAVQIFNNTLYVSTDTKEGSNSARSYIGTLGTAGTPPTATVSGGPVQLTGFGTSSTGKYTIGSGAVNNGNGFNTGVQINLSPVNFFFANATTLYVTDSGRGKQNSANSSVGDGGLQKWTKTGSTWNLIYTLYNGLNLVLNTNSSGATGLYGLAGKVSGDVVQLYVTNYTLNDLDTTYLYGITDSLSNTTPPMAANTFTLLDTAPLNSNFKGVSFAPSLPAGAVTILSSPSGFTFTSSGTGCAPGTYTTPQTLLWTASSSCTLSVVSPQKSVAAGNSHAFVQWEDGTTSTTRTVTAPSGNATYTASFTNPVAPTITWPPPASIAVGSALSGSQLNATANVAGTFTYSPLPGTVLPVGANQPLSVTFTPSDATDYTTATASNNITVTPLAPASPASLTITKLLTRSVIGSGTFIVVHLTVANNGGTDAANATITGVKVGTTAATPANQFLGTVTAGNSASATFTVPASVGASGASSTLTVTGTYTGGTFGSTARIVLP